MTISQSEIQKIARLARLTIDEGHIHAMTRDVSAILDFVEQMSAVDTTGVVPMAHPMDATQPLREDVVTEHDQRELFQRNAPETESGLYLVPKVIEG